MLSQQFAQTLMYDGRESQHCEDRMDETTLTDSSQARQGLFGDTVALWLTALAFPVIHIAFSGRYGFHRDELLSYSNAMHLDWCYVVYPPSLRGSLAPSLQRSEPVLSGTAFCPQLRLDW